MAKGHNGPGKGPMAAVVIQKPKDFKTSLKFILKYVKTEKFLLVFAVILTFTNIIASLLATNMLQPIIDNYLLPKFSNPTVSERISGLINGVIQMGVIYIVSTIAAYLQSRVMIKATQKIINRLRGDLFNHLETLSIKYFDSHTHGELMSRFTNDVDTLNEALSNSLITFIGSVVTLIGIIGIMLSKNIFLTLLTLGLTPIMFLVAQKILNNSSKYFKEQQKNLGRVNGYVEEIITGQKVVKVFCHEDIAEKEFEKINEELRVSATKAQGLAGIMMPVMMNANNVIYAIIAMLGGLLSVNGMLSVGALIVFLNLTKQFGRPINEASNQFNAVVTALAGAERIHEIMEQEPEIDELKYPTELVKEDGDFFWQQYDKDGNKLKLVPVKGDVRFIDVTFGYEPEKVVLKNISLYAKPGQKIAFVGSTGAGKTTILNLLTRFYDISEGVITFDGIDIKEIKKESLRHALSMVLQDTHLFTGTVRENIRYGNLAASDDDVEAAARLASAHSFINRLPYGYDTIIEGDGSNLSQGQRQLLNIARAAVADAPVLVLDEATSSVDTRTERHIEHGLDRLMTDRTTFVIAHRLSTVRNSKAIMVLEHGEIIERGTHEDLLTERGRYYELYTGVAELD